MVGLHAVRHAGSRFVLALAALLWGCGNGEDGENAFGLIEPPNSHFVTESGPLSSGGAAGQISYWNTTSFARDANHIAFLTSGSTTTFTWHSNPSDPTDPNNYGGAVSNSEGGRKLHVSKDGGKTWAQFNAPDYTRRIHLWNGRGFVMGLVGNGREVPFGFEVREFNLDTGELIATIGSPLAAWADHILVGGEIRTVVASGRTMIWQKLDLATGMLDETHTEMFEASRGLSLFDSADGGETFYSVGSIPYQFEEQYGRFHWCQRRADFATKSVESDCVPAMNWPGYFVTEFWRVRPPSAAGIPFWAASGPGMSYTLDGHVYGVLLNGPDKTPQSLYFGRGKVGDQRWFDRSMAMAFPGLFAIRPMGDSGARRFIHVTEDNSVYDVLLPTTFCVGGSSCKDRDELVAAWPLEGRAPHQRQTWMLVYEADISAQATMYANTRRFALYVREAEVDVRPFEETRAVLGAAEAPGCIAAPTKGGHLDEVCAFITSCGVSTMSYCLQRTMLSDEAFQAQVIAASDCDAAVAIRWPTQDYFLEPCTGPAYGAYCNGDKATFCDRGDQATRYDCALIGASCESYSPSPYTYEPTIHCGGTFGCEWVLSSWQPLVDVLPGICQGDKILYMFLDALRTVDCAELGLGTCRLDDGVARCKP
jgi:hypothetical protein